LLSETLKSEPTYEHPDIPTAVSPAETAVLYELAEGKIVLELGSWLGASTVVLCSSAKRVHAVDWHRGDEHAGFHNTAEAYLANTRQCENLITHIGRFEEVVPLFRVGLFDFVFVDGYHTYDATYQAGILSRFAVKPGGKVAFHDYGLFDVKPAVDHLFGPPAQVVESLAVVDA